MSSSNGDKKSVSFEGQLELAKALDYLKSLQAALKKGTAYVQNGAEVVALAPEGAVTMAVEAKSKKDKQSISIALQWERAEASHQSASGTLTISEREPELVVIFPEDE